MPPNMRQREKERKKEREMERDAHMRSAYAHMRPAYAHMRSRCPGCAPYTPCVSGRAPYTSCGLGLVVQGICDHGHHVQAITITSEQAPPPQHTDTPWHVWDRRCGGTAAGPLFTRCLGLSRGEARSLSTSLSHTHSLTHSLSLSLSLSLMDSAECLRLSRGFRVYGCAFDSAEGRLPLY